MQLYIQLHLQECTDVIEKRAAQLEPTFEGLWKKVCQGSGGVLDPAGYESLWEIPFADGRGRMAYTFAVKHTYC